jgi:pilus assembly protein CpaB
MNKRLIGVAIAAVLALVGTILILSYVNDADDRARAEVELVEVFVIEDRVAAGADEAELRQVIGTSEVTADAVVDGVLTDLTQLDGQVAAIDLVPGEQILLSRLIDATSYDDGRSHLTSVPDGLSEITVSLEPQRVVGGELAPGDTVGVLASYEPWKVTSLNIDNVDPLETEEEYFARVVALGALPPTVESANVTHFLLHQVLVTKVQVEELPVEYTDDDGNTIDTGTLAPTGNLLITLALEPDDVQRLVFSAEFGLLWMSYEPTESTGHEDLDPVTRNDVYDHPHEDDDESGTDELISAEAEPVVDQTEAES